MAQTNVRKEIAKTPITLDSIKASENQKEGTLTAQVRQTITTVTHYPSKRVDSDLQDGLFSTSDFGFAEKAYPNVEKRVAWLLVPKSVTKEQVEAQLAKANADGGLIYKVLSNEPILDNNQKYAIQAALRDMNYFADAQVVRYPEGTKDDTGKDVSNQIVLDGNGNPQYKRNFFSATPKEDVDLRDASKVFLSEAIKAELKGASALAGQGV